MKRLRATTAARLHSYGDHNSQLAYDSDTVSLLQPLDVIGGKHLPPNHVVETTSAVRAYWIAADQLAGLPPRLQEVSACGIRTVDVWAGCWQALRPALRGQGLEGQVRAMWSCCL